MGRCEVCGGSDCPRMPHVELPERYPFGVQLPKPPEPTPRRARRTHDRMRRPETHERGGEDR